MGIRERGVARACGRAQPRNRSEREGRPKKTLSHNPHSFFSSAREHLSLFSMHHLPLARPTRVVVGVPARPGGPGRVAGELIREER